MQPDRIIAAFDRALRATASALPLPAAAALPPVAQDQALTPEQRAHAAALMRVNHVGEVCAQALYHGQALAASTPALRAHMERAAAEEGLHLDWTATRIAELGGRTSLLNPFWYAGAFALGALAGRAGDAVSLGFVAETERQVESHLEGHLTCKRNGLPVADGRSREIVVKMRDDEARHRNDAVAAGGTPLPLPARLAMKAMAKVMTTLAYRV
jgi:ubiquinone biosynthesis monooxygenase Coq7